MMTLALQFLETAAILVGVVFGLFQLRQLRIQHDVQGGAELLRSMQSPETASAALALFDLPDNLPSNELKSRLGEKFQSVLALCAMFEGMGALVARGQVPIRMYEDFFRVGTVLCWRKVRRYTEEQRAAGWTNLFEWFQWLAERMEERARVDDDVPAFERFRDWRSEADYRRLRPARRG